MYWQLPFWEKSTEQKLPGLGITDTESQQDVSMEKPHPTKTLELGL